MGVLEGADRLILVVNPGSTSTKLALFAGEEERAERTIRHSATDLARFERVADQEEWRAALVSAFLAEEGVAPDRLAAVVGRGGLLRPLPGGTYRVNEKMRTELRSPGGTEHASNLGALLAGRLAGEAGCPAFIVDPVVTDELADVARLTGLPEISRRSVFHALSQRAAARRACGELGLRYEEASVVVAHLGGGISVGAHRRGRVVEVNNALDGDGPFSPERAGALPTGALVDLCFSPGATRSDLRKRIAGAAGLVAHLGTNDLQEVESRLEDPEVRLVFDALCYGIARAITGCFAALERLPDAVVLTGGLACSEKLVGEVRRRTAFAAPVLVYPENLEMRALAEGARRVLTGQEQARDY